MRISVAMCVYDGARHLGDQLESIARQRRVPDEVVICDDGSTDGSLGLIERFAAEVGFPVRPHRNAENLRTTKNFERAIGLCDGDVIVTADQDDVWYPSKLERIEAEFQESHRVGLLFSDADLIDGQGRPIGARLWPSVRFSNASRLEIEKGNAFKTLLRRPCITGATMAFRSDLREFLLPIPREWTHDQWIGLMVASVARLLPVAEPLMRYRRHPDNQIGVNGVSVAERLRGSLGRRSSRFLDEADQYRQLRQCLERRLPGRPELLGEIERKVSHFRSRGTLSPGRMRRIPAILRELALLRYSRYSGSALSFARDLMAKS